MDRTQACQCIGEGGNVLRGAPPTVYDAINTTLAWQERKMSSEFDRRISMNTQLRPEIIHAAIQGFEAQKQQLDAQIAELRGMLNGSEPKATVASQSGVHRQVSAAARRRMADAQRKRWAAARETPEP